MVISLRDLSHLSVYSSSNPLRDGRYFPNLKVPPSSYMAFHLYLSSSVRTESSSCFHFPRSSLPRKMVRVPHFSNTTVYLLTRKARNGHTLALDLFPLQLMGIYFQLPSFFRICPGTASGTRSPLSPGDSFPRTVYRFSVLNLLSDDLCSLHERTPLSPPSLYLAFPFFPNIKGKL